MLINFPEDNSLIVYYMVYGARIVSAILYYSMMCGVCVLNCLLDFSFFILVFST